MRNTMEIESYRAVIAFDPDIDMFRGEFVGLNGGADFYAQDIAGLRREGGASLKAFLDMCREDGVSADPGDEGHTRPGERAGAGIGDARQGLR